MVFRVGRLLPGVVFLVGSTLSVVGLPKVEIPPPSGPYKVGRLNVELIDRTRTNHPASPEEGFRSLALTVWYPAEATRSNKPARYMNPLASAYLVSARRDFAYRLPAEWGPAWAERVVVHATTEADLTKKPGLWPVLLYEHGLNSMVSLGQGFLEDLASQGFVIVGIDNTNLAGAAVFQDGRVRYSVPVPDGRDWWDFYLSQYPTVVKDFSFVLDELTRTKSAVLGPLFEAKLDLTRVGALGISFGGSSALDFAATDPRVVAVANLDGGHFGTFPAAEFSTPLLLVLSEGHFQYDGSLIAAWSRNTAPSWRVEIAGARHENFGDTPFLLKALAPDKTYLYSETGTMDPSRCLELIRLALKGFFQQNLGAMPDGGTPRGWEASLAGFPEAKLETK